MSNYTYIRDEVSTALSRWELVQDCVTGQERIKKLRTKYLPQPNPLDKSPENTTRYDQYVDRAVFFNVTNRTMRGLNGTVFKTDPIFHIHEDMEVIKDDATGDGVPLVQQAKKALNYGLMFGRGGLLVDFPSTDDEGVSNTLADKEAGYLRPTIALYEPQQIINWRTKRIGAKAVLSLVVLKEDYTVDDDGFAPEIKSQWRALRLDERNVYVVEIYREGLGMVGIYEPKGADGQPFNHIPFHFFGAENNDPEIDDAPLYDLAEINVAHYRNSADYEESVYVVGQPTPYISGLTQNWVDNVLKGTIQLGARAAVPLPEGGQMALVQAEPNTLSFEAMGHKEDQMIAIGAKIIERAEAQRTATEVGAEKDSENSVLGTVAQNVSAAYTNALLDCTIFLGLPTEVAEERADGTIEQVDVSFELSTEFDQRNRDGEARRMLVEEWLHGAIAFTEMREGLREAGVAHLSDEDAKEAIDAAKEEDQKRAIELAQATKPLDDGGDDDEEPEE